MAACGRYANRHWVQEAKEPPAPAMALQLIDYGSRETQGVDGKTHVEQRLEPIFLYAAHHRQPRPNRHLCACVLAYLRLGALPCARGCLPPAASAAALTLAHTLACLLCRPRARARARRSPLERHYAASLAVATRMPKMVDKRAVRGMQRVVAGMLFGGVFSWVAGVWARFLNHFRAQRPPCSARPRSQPHTRIEPTCVWCSCAACGVPGDLATEGSGEEGVGFAGERYASLTPLGDVQLAILPRRRPQPAGAPTDKERADVDEGGGRAGAAGSSGAGGSKRGGGSGGPTEALLFLDVYGADAFDKVQRLVEGTERVLERGASATCRCSADVALLC
jgi:hypothetical protein